MGYVCGWEGSMGLCPCSEVTTGSQHETDANMKQNLKKKLKWL